MSLDRWWNPLSRWRRVDARATAPAPLPPEPRHAAAPAAAAAVGPAQPAAAPRVGAALPANADAGMPIGADHAVIEDKVEEEPLATRNLRFFCWLIGTPANAGARPPPGALIGEMLGRVDEIIASEVLRAGLLPRAPHVVPQLMKTLRDEGYSSADVASRISRDVVLTAEVVRSATSVLQRGDDGEEIDLARAVQVVGTQGLRRAIANVVLRPIFDAKGSSLSARAATQIWKDADRKARLCAACAGQAGLDPFDGYLAGLLHNSGWTAVLRAIDNLEDLAIGAVEVSHPEVVPQVIRRRDALFGALVGPWKLGPLMDELAEEIGSVGLEDARSPLGIALRDADRLAALRALAPAGQRGASVVPRWSQLAKTVQDSYSGLGA
ncbi:MAG TPA: HDOD domain-containing protein [Caldimonas sp.]|jgi:HD-like signal output (HDOD) protein